MSLNPIHGEVYSIQHYVIKVCQWLTTGRLFSPCPPVSSTNKTDHHDITEILLKVTLNTINQTNHFAYWFNYFASQLSIHYNNLHIIWRSIDKLEEENNKFIFQEMQAISSFDILVFSFNLSVFSWSEKNCIILISDISIDKYRIMTVLKVETDFITSIKASRYD